MVVNEKYGLKVFFKTKSILGLRRVALRTVGNLKVALLLFIIAAFTCATTFGLCALSAT
jgi:hypothetical protein